MSQQRGYLEIVNVCEWCGRSYLSEHGADPRYCSDACKADAEMADRIAAEADAAYERWMEMD
jgi:hypothetical protein